MILKNLNHSKSSVFNKTSTNQRKKDVWSSKSPISNIFTKEKELIHMKSKANYFPSKNKTKQL